MHHPPQRRYLASRNAGTPVVVSEAVGTIYTQNALIGAVSGATSPANFYQGVMQMVALFPALTQAEEAKLYARMSTFLAAAGSF